MNYGPTHMESLPLLFSFLQVSNPLASWQSHSRICLKENSFSLNQVLQQHSSYQNVSSKWSACRPPTCSVCFQFDFFDELPPAVNHTLGRVDTPGTAFRPLYCCLSLFNNCQIMKYMPCSLHSHVLILINKF